MTTKKIEYTFNDLTFTYYDYDLYDEYGYYFSINNEHLPLGIVKEMIGIDNTIKSLKYFRKCLNKDGKRRTTLYKVINNNLKNLE